MKRVIILLVTVVLICAACQMPPSTPAPTLSPSPTSIPVSTPSPYSYEEEIAAKGILAIKKQVANPDAMEVYKIAYYYDRNGNKDLHINYDCTVEDRTGKLVRTYYQVMNSYEFSYLGTADDELDVAAFEDPGHVGLAFKYGTELDVERVMGLYREWFK